MKSIYCILPIIRIHIFCVSLFCAFILCSNYTTAQNTSSKRDILISKEIQSFITQSDSTDRIEELIQDTFYQTNDTLLGLAYCKIYLERGRKEENDAIQFFANFQMAYISFLQSKHNEALKRAYTSTRIAEKMKDTMSSISGNVLLGSTWYVLGAYDDALVPYLLAKDLATETQNVSYEIICLNNIANIRAKLDRYESALNSYNSVLEILDKEAGNISDQRDVTRLSALVGKVLCLAELKRFDEAQEVYTTGIELAEKNNDQISKGRFKINLGKVYHEKGEYHTSLGFLKEGKEMLRATSLQNNLYITDFYIAENLSKQEKYKEALLLLDDIFERVGPDTYTDKIEEMYELAIQISRIQQNQAKEVEYLRRSKEIIDAKNEKNKFARKLLYEGDIKEQVLENEKLASEKTQSLVDKKIITAVAVVLVSILLLVFLSYYRKAKLKEQKFLAIIEDISKKTISKETKKPQKNSTIKDEKAKAILEQLETLESSHFYLSPDATLHTTAKLLNTNTTYLSKALNAVKKQTFSQYVNKLRIDYVLVKLKEDSVFRSYTIHAISKEIGYKSATTFIKEFKNKTGLNPSYYIKKIER
ncbi:helix-turn-helix domain-containing protein [Kordia sp.]|uniref:helix-turn-helix domain-containing protein n=1 Tax=Kordia sp. TaxID=1965332 RepID=UPI003B5A7FCE